MKAMIASLALASGCTGEPDEMALPYVNAPEAVTPGKPKWYATALTFAGYAQPVLGKTYVGRPVKLEGNPDHPLTGGATDIFMQAALLGLYDPARSQGPAHLGQPTSWQAFDTAIAERAEELNRRQGAGFRLLTGPVSSPTLARQIGALLARWPQARWHVFDPAGEDNRAAATKMVFGRKLALHARLDQADVIVSLDDDLLGPGPLQASHSHLWSNRRLAFQAGSGASRLLVAEPTPTLTGAKADERLIVRHARVGMVATAIGAELGLDGPAVQLSAPEKQWVTTAVQALRGSQGRALLSVGAQHSAELQAFGLLIHERLGAFGTTLGLTEPIIQPASNPEQSLEALVQDMNAGRVDTLAVLGVNPVYAAPADLPLREAMQKVAFRLHAGLYFDETAEQCQWHAPLQHDLESWSDARSADGTASIVQPLVRPFYAVRSLHALLDKLSGGSGSDRDLVQATWRANWGAEFDARWRDALFRGFVENSASAQVSAAPVDRSVRPGIEPDQPEELVVLLRPDPTVWDGCFADNTWLQETPKPLSTITWGNVVAISPHLASTRKITNGDEVRLSVQGREIVGPAWVQPGQEPQTITLTMGYGRSRSAIAGGLGYNAFTLRSAREPWHLTGASLDVTGARETIACTQPHQAMDGYDFVRTVDQARAHEPAEKASHGASLYPERAWESPSWGMSIDLDLCTGCSACVVACVAENNVPMVGKELVAEGRHMHWLRVDHYHEGDIAAPKSYFQPVPCMHCEQAPCEMGCPVNAAVHSFDGLNLQVYNRCIGTRTCSSYCPYKVRRFNWFDYTGDDPASVKAMRNPDVTVRSRGVMEKCTYCVQRIAEARISAQIAGRPIQDGEVVTACQQACPTKAILFGNILDTKAEVSRRKANPRNYSLLEEANTRPRTTYLARIESTENPDGGEGHK